ncbi:DUF397 domain-containing protein [Pseudonocardia sp. MH-G8]|uniref:DUF397 domain-containing protein n=1 Tax=Pseudonocardia sp. MH-G8 TaxID=1854588 RepID=UPI001E51C1E0|nr:DUF397 domain-containing protein [Pseudonocardia sp. MH-G8]
MEESARGAGPRFRISSFSGGENCVEVARLEDSSVVVRHSRSATAGSLVFTGEEWVAFVAGVKNGEFDPA